MYILVKQKQPPVLFYKKALKVLKSFEIITGKQTPVFESLFNNIADLRPATLLKMRPQHKRFQRILQNFYEYLFSGTPLRSSPRPAEAAARVVL